MNILEVLNELMDVSLTCNHSMTENACVQWYDNHVGRSDALRSLSVWWSRLLAEMLNFKIGGIMFLGVNFTFQTSFNV